MLEAVDNHHLSLVIITNNTSTFYFLTAKTLQVTICFLKHIKIWPFDFNERIYAICVKGISRRKYPLFAEQILLFVFFLSRLQVEDRFVCRWFPCKINMIHDNHRHLAS